MKIDGPVGRIKEAVMTSQIAYLNASHRALFTWLRRRAQHPIRRLHVGRMVSAAHLPECASIDRIEYFLAIVDCLRDAGLISCKFAAAEPAIRDLQLTPKGIDEAKHW